MSSPSDYRPCAAMLLFNPAGKVLMADRNDCNDPAWQLPQGGVESGESIEESVFRELEEEIGTSAAKIISIADEKICYDWPKTIKWKGQENWLGQCVTLVALIFLGDDKEINVHTHSPEFRDWKWVPLETIPELIIPFKKPLYDYAVERFTEIRDTYLLSENNPS
ncbi:MAG: RNA pyrophosphohydrolase [Rhodospirillales bacterium]|nr:RNA pyrophosphohydrolase [Rhodospirillales bacterium]|tara:strand:+ start:391 stop:885 length:495 start_codon:yes stop_codon:yes gene_type:complete